MKTITYCYNLISFIKSEAMAVPGYVKILFAVSLQLFTVAGFSQQIDVNSLAFSNKANQFRVAFDVTASPRHRVFVLDNPSRLVIDIQDARLRRSISQPPSTHPLFSRVRAAKKDNSDLRVVVDLKQAINAKKFALSSNNNDKNRLIVALIDNGATSEMTTAQRVETKTNANNFSVSNSSSKKARDVVIAVDAGHGGDDPGAIGGKGTQEKKVTFAIAKKLATLINAQSGMKAVMVRKGDYYVGLRRRMNIARAAKADLFISIHADAYQNAEAKGASVYTLTRNGATSEAARWLADSENSAELIGGVSLDDKEDVLASVLLDLSQTATQEASVDAAGHVLRNFQELCDLHKGSVQKAGFLVLKSPDMPSILVETAFISNPAEERNLLNKSYQSKIANAIFRGVRNYFKQDNVLYHLAGN